MWAFTRRGGSKKYALEHCRKCRTQHFWNLTNTTVGTNSKDISASAASILTFKNSKMLKITHQGINTENISP